MIAEVAGESCSSQPGLSDYRAAIQEALGKVPGANLLVDVSFYSEGRADGLLNREVCRIVVGKAWSFSRSYLLSIGASTAFISSQTGDTAKTVETRYTRYMPDVDSSVKIVEAEIAE